MQPGFREVLGALVPGGGYFSIPTNETLEWFPCLTWREDDDGRQVVGEPHCYYIHSSWVGGLRCPECVETRKAGASQTVHMGQL